MNKQIEALKQALDALDCIYSPLHVREINKVGAAMSAIREALAEQPAQQPAQQPVSVTDELVNAYCEAWKQSFLADNAYHTVSVSPQDRKHIEAGLKAALAEQFCDKNCTWLDHHPECDKAEQPAQQELVAVYVGETWCGSVVRLYEDLPLETPLYTSPQPSKPWVGLTEFDIDQIPYSCSHADSRLIAYAIEAKLKEKNNG